MFEKFDIEDKNICKVCVVATMSSGKSTFINAIIGDEVMPEKNEACTARTMAVLDNDAATIKKAHIIRKNGSKEIVTIDSRDVLERVNNDEDVVDFLVETNIKSVENTSRALMLVDTPGVNNSEDKRHGERTEEFLKQMDMGVIIYLLNATQLATNDDSILLQRVSDYVKRQAGSVKIIFVINKIDALDFETESIAGTVKIAKDYIEQHGIANPVIYPLSALAAKTLRMALYRREMTRRELRKLEDIYEHYQSKDNNMLAYAMTDELSEESYEIGDLQVTAQELQRAIDNTGITAVEKSLAGFMREIERHYAPEIIIKSQLSQSVAQQFQKTLDEIVSFPQQCEWTRFKATNDLLEENTIIQNLNNQLQNLDNLEAKIDMTGRFDLCTSDINVLIQNIEVMKASAFKVFETGSYIGVKRAKGFYFCPEKDLNEAISIKNFYLMSEDGTVWKRVQFGRLNSLVEAGKTIYLYNEYSTFVFAIKPETGANIIALLDTKIPIKIVKIAGLSAQRVTLDEVTQYMEELKSDAEKRRKEIEAAEEQLRRTYKGIVFQTEEQKAEIIQSEQELLEYCANLEQRTHAEILSKKEVVEKLPNSIFAGYVSKLISALDIQENREKNVFFNRIELAGLSELDTILTDLTKEHYSENVKKQIVESIEGRRLICQRIALDLMLKDYETYDRLELKNLSSEIGKKPFNDKIKGEYVEKVEKQSGILEMKELQKLCADLETLSIDGLQHLEKIIRNGEYQEQFTNQYYQMIRARTEFLHVHNLEQFCIPIASVDRNALLDIENKIKEEDCNPDLKVRFLSLVEQRREKIDYEDLCELTKDLSTKTLKNLEEIYKELQSGRYNQKFVKSFLVKCRVCLESAQQANVNSMIRSLSDMDKSQVHSVWQNIEKNNFADRVARIAKEKIEERIYELDMFELMNIKNEFDSLSLMDIQNLRSVIRQKSICNRAIATYEKKLKERERIVAYQLVSPLSCLVKQTVEQYGLSGLNISIATFSADYLQLLRSHFDELGKEEYGEIPAFFYPECSKLAMSRNYLYYMTNAGYSRIRLTEIRSYGIEKKMFQEVLAITFVNGEIVTISGGLNKKTSQAFVAFLTFVHQNASNDVLLTRYQPYSDHVVELSSAQFEMREVPHELSENVITEILLSRLVSTNMNKSIPTIKYEGSNNWANYCNKVINGMGIMNDRIVFYYDKTILGSAKDGFAFGMRFVHIKSGQQPLVSIPINTIFSVELTNGKLVVKTQDNNNFITEFNVSDENDKKQVVEWLDEYIKGIQLFDYLSIDVNSAKIAYETSTKNKGNTCPNCNTQLKHGAKFCSQCGTKVIELETVNSSSFFFCSECGNKILKGKKFCSQCGTRVEG